MPEPTPAERRALFAQEFQDTTNLDQRRRYAQELSEAKARSEERDKADFELMQRRDPKLMQAVTGRDREKRLREEVFFRSDLAERKFSWDQEKAIRGQALQERSIALREKMEQRQLSQAERELDDAFRIEDETDRFLQGEKGLRERGLIPGSSAYRNGLAQIMADNPYADPDIRKPFAEQSGITNPDDMQAMVAEIRSQFGPGVKIVVDKDGIPRPASIEPEKTKPSTAPRIDFRRRDALAKEEAELAFTEKMTPAIQKRLDYLRREIGTIDTQERESKAAPAAPTQAAPAQSKAITIDDARAILKEVGGDKEKARALAKERGYQW